MRLFNRRVTFAIAVLACGWLVPVSMASAATAPGPHWAVLSQAAPTDFHPGDRGDFYEVIAVNDGGESTSGEIKITDTLPHGVTATGVVTSVENKYNDRGEFNGPAMTCSPVPTSGAVTCTTAEAVPAGLVVFVKIEVEVPADASGALANTVTIEGGSAKVAVSTESTPVTPVSQPVPYGASLSSDVVDAAGATDEQAGSHPFSFTAMLAFNIGSVNTTPQCKESPGCAEPVADPKDLEVALPRGIVGNPTAVPYCTQAEFHRQSFYPCPADTQVGAMNLYFYGAGTPSQYSPVYNVEPPPGQPAELGFSVSTVAHIPIFFHVRGNSDYGLTADISEITEFEPVQAATLSIWGVPTEAAHNGMRLGTLPEGSTEEACNLGVEGCADEATPKPFLTLPSSCGGEALSLPVAGDSWQEQFAAPYPNLTTSALLEGGVKGCEALSSLFSPSIEVSPSTAQAGVPAGYGVNIGVPQDEEPEGLTTSDVRDVEVSLPQGTVISPSSANGLVGCSEAQFQLKSGVAGACPVESKIATVKISTPLLSSPLTGSMYVGQPECSPCSPVQAGEGKLVPLLLEAKGSGVVVKLEGHTKIDQQTGQLTAVFDENPQLPFDELQVNVEGGEDAPLLNPSSCGVVGASAAITSWSSPDADAISAPAVAFSGCSPQGFSPSAAAGMSGSAQAGSYSPFDFTLTRPEGQQQLAGITVQTPPGLLGKLAGVSLCPEAQANAGTCSSASEIGSSSATVGEGSEPYTINGGHVYLTGPYKGQPFGLSIVVPAQAGPFTLAGVNGTGGEGAGTVVVRASIAVNPATAALTITSNPLPTTLDGIPLDVRQVAVNVGRAGFMFNATNCAAQSITSSVSSAEGQSVQIASAYQAVNCASLPFKPSFTASTGGRASKAGGASLTVKVASKGGPQAGGGEANIHSVKVDLPKQLPSRLTTLQKACTEAQFNTNPAGCPKESDVGTASASTPILAHGLEGPAYLVSHGGAAFPDLEIVLQGEGITLVLDGQTNIKRGITSSTFKTIPDAPITGFELKLPTGKFSILTTDLPQSAHYSLCGQTLAMPTAITGQNGAVIKQTTTITVNGCTKAKTLTRAQKLGKALKACGKKAKNKRLSCQAKAKAQYGPATAKVKKGRK